MLASLRCVAPPHERRAIDAVPHHQKPNIGLLFGLAKESWGILQSSRHIAAHIWYHPLPVHHRKRVLLLAERRAELPSAGIVLSQFRRDVAASRDQGAAQFDAHLELASVTRGTLWQQPYEVQRAT